MEKPLCLHCNKRHGRKVWKSDSGMKFGSKKCMDDYTRGKTYNPNIKTQNTKSKNEIKKHKWIYLTDISNSYEDDINISELKENLQEIDYPVRYDFIDDYEKRFVYQLLRIHSSIKYSYRDMRFKINRMKLDISSSFDEEGYYSSIELGFSSLEKYIWNKQQNFEDKMNSGHDFFTFSPKEIIKISSKSIKENEEINKYIDPIIKWAYKKSFYKCREEGETIQHCRNEITEWYYNKFEVPHHKINKYNYKPISQLILKDKCLICRNEISDYPNHFLFCVICIELVDFNEWESQYRESIRFDKFETNLNNYCLFVNCFNTTTEGYFCKEHKNEIFKLSLKRGKLFYNTPLYKRTKKIGLHGKYSKQPYEYNKKILKEYLLSNKLEIENNIEYIKLAPFEHQPQCFHFLSILILVDEGSNNFIEYWYRLFDFYENTNQEPPIDIIDSYLRVSPTIDILWELIMFNSMDIHSSLSYSILKGLSGYYDNVYNDFISTYKSDFKKLYSKRLNKNKKEFLSILPLNPWKRNNIYNTIVYEILKLTMNPKFLGFESTSIERFDYDDELSTLCNSIKLPSNKRKSFNDKITSLSNSLPNIIRYIHYDRHSVKKVSDYMINLTNGIETLIREKYGFPPRGEYWVSETELYNKIKEKFSQHTVHHDFGPDWLKSQRLDVYIEELNLGFEYQGEQHQRPIEFFGGEKAFKKTVERDTKKKRLCEENNCKLIYIYPDETDEELNKKIQDIYTETIEIH